MIKHQMQLMPKENSNNIDPLAMDEEFVLPDAPLPATVNQNPFEFEDTRMVSTLLSRGRIFIS